MRLNLDISADVQEHLGTAAVAHAAEAAWSGATCVTCQQPIPADEVTVVRVRTTPSGDRSTVEFTHRGHGASEVIVEDDHDEAAAGREFASCWLPVLRDSTSPQVLVVYEPDGLQALDGGGEDVLLVNLLANGFQRATGSLSDLTGPLHPSSRILIDSAGAQATVELPGGQEILHVPLHYAAALDLALLAGVAGFLYGSHLRLHIPTSEHLDNQIKLGACAYATLPVLGAP